MVGIGPYVGVGIERRWLAAKLVQCRQCGEQVYLMVALTCAVASLNQGRHAVHDAAIHRARQFASQIGLHWTQRKATLCPCPTRYPKTGTACAASEVVSSEVVSSSDRDLAGYGRQRRLGDIRRMQATGRSRDILEPEVTGLFWACCLHPGFCKRNILQDACGA